MGRHGKRKRRRDSESEGNSSDLSNSSGSDADYKRSHKRKKKRRHHSDSSEPRRHRKKKKDKKRSKKDRHAEGIKNALEKKEARKREKELAKEKETFDEKRARRIKKRIDKEVMQGEREQTEYFGYSNDNNRFGDADLTTPFVWKKKWESQGISSKGVNLSKAVKKTIRKKQTELRQEIDKIKVARKIRQEEKELNEIMRSQIQKELDAENYELLEKKEEEFHVEQAKLRSKMRIKEGRWQPIDLIAKNISVLCGDEAFDDDIDIELHEPYQIIEKLEYDELEELLKEIKSHIELGVNLDHWHNLRIVVQDEMRTNQSQSSNSGDFHGGVVDDITRMMVGKSHAELLEFKTTIGKKIETADEDDGSNGAVDVEYWENLLKYLKVFIAKAFLVEQHKSLLYKRVVQLQKQHMDKQDAHGADVEGVDPNSRFDDMSDEAESSSMKDEETCYDPVYVESHSREYTDILPDCADPEHDRQNLLESREMVLRSKLEEVQRQERIKLEDVQSAQSFLSQPTDNQWGMSAEDMYRRESLKPIEDGEEVFSSIVDVKNETYWWHDKYRPRKPRFFNRVKTGYEWNKYNQTHYDHDNPPPKIVQGYKFNVFYPDLVDPTKPPTYSLDTCGDNVDYATLRFQAGPPYEDIAFKIVNKEWEESHKRGFKCRFERGILHLYFNFKQFRYRR